MVMLHNGQRNSDQLIFVQDNFLTLRAELVVVTDSFSDGSVTHNKGSDYLLCGTFIYSKKSSRP